MPIQMPARRLMRHVGLEFVEAKVGGGGHRSKRKNKKRRKVKKIKRHG